MVLFHQEDTNASLLLQEVWDITDHSKEERSMVRRITTIGLAAVCVVAMTAPGAAAQKKTAAASAKAQTNPAGTVSMTGCLHADGSRFMLTDLPDAQAPKGRNWKTGFITKNRKDMEVVAASSSL